MKALVVNGEARRKLQLKDVSSNPRQIDRQGAGPKVDEEGAARVTILPTAGKLLRKFGLAHAGLAMQDQDTLSGEVAKPGGDLFQIVLTADERRVAARRNVAAEMSKDEPFSRGRSPRED